MERTRWRAGGAPPPDQVRARSRQRDSPRARIRRPPPSQALQRGVEPPPSGLPGYPVGRLCNSAASRAREEMKSRRDPASHAWIWAQARATNYSARPRSARPLSAKRSRARDSAAVAAISLQAGWGSACAFTRLRKPGSSASRSPTGALLPMQPVASAGRRPAAASRLDQQVRRSRITAWSKIPTPPVPDCRVEPLPGRAPEQIHTFGATSLRRSAACTRQCDHARVKWTVHGEHAGDRGR